MYKVCKLVLGSTLCAAMAFAGTPMVFANTTGTPTSASSPPATPTPPAVQDLTGLSTITTSVTGQADATFASIEQTRQQYPITDAYNWTGFCRQGGRDITVQFAQPVNVQNISINMEQLVSLAVYFPSQVRFEGFANGQWYALSTDSVNGDHTTGSLSVIDPTNSTHTFAFTNAVGVEVTAVRVSFPVDIWVFADGLSVTGSTTSVGVTPTAPTYPVVTTDQLPSQPMTPAQARGIKNMLLVYTGGHGSLGTWTSSDFKPMLEYTDPAGLTNSPLFDTMLFLPYGDSNPDTKTGWNNYLSDLFAPKQQLAALNQAVGTSNTDLNRWGHKEKVVLSIPYFPAGSNNFGRIGSQNINFNGTTNGPNSLNSRTIATYWYINNLLLDWQMANYQNLQLVGLYWDHEQFGIGAPNEQQIFQIVEAAAHQHNLPLLWIPSYGAAGSREWKSLGLDGAWLQSNYMDQGTTADVGRITGAVNTANEYGMGMEVELTTLNSSALPAYQTLLNMLSADGFGGQNVSHAFYDGSKLLVDAAQSTDPATRNIYDETANFILNGTPTTQSAP